MLRRSLAALSRPSRPRSFRRYQSQDHRNAAQTEATEGPADLRGNFQESLSFTLHVFRRFVAFSVIGVIGVATTTAAIWEGAHMWVESVELARDNDAEVRAWEWDLEAEKWSGGSVGGTDPALGLAVRHTIRAAWMAQHWGIGSTAAVVSPRARAASQELNAVEGRLQRAQLFLSSAISNVAAKVAAGKVRPQTLVELLTRHADVLERMGTHDALLQSQMQYERVWAGSGAKGIDAARTAAKLGDLSSRLGEAEGALAWWARAIQVAQGGGKEVAAVPVIPTTAPTSPAAQRILTSTLVSLSAFYATKGDLRQAQATEEASLKLLRSIPIPLSLATATPPQSLHSLYLLHRSSLISIHLAEVLYGLRKSPEASFTYLRNAAESSERVALALAGLPFIHPDAPTSSIPHPPAPESPLLPVYSKSTFMKKPASSLLRDARRSAAEAWSLMGVLNEKTDAAKALECYERALGWVGISADKAGGIAEPSEGILESEWKVLWDNYVRVRNAVKKT